MSSYYMDSDLRPGSSSSISQLFIAFLCAAYAVYAACSVFQKTSHQLDQLLIIIFLLIIFVYIFSGIYQIVEGRRTVSTIKFLSERFEIQNIISQKKLILDKDLLSISDGNKSWFVRPSIAFQNDFPSFTIHLKDGRFFRVSPHMERIDELKAKLEQIIEDNKHRGS